MSTDDRFSEDENKHFHLVKPCTDNESKALSNPELLKSANITEKTGTKAYSIKLGRRNQGCSILVRQRLLAIGQWGFENLINDLYLQLDEKLIDDNADHLCKKYRKRARSYFQDLYELGRAEIIIDTEDLHGRAKSVLDKLDKETAEYVIREVVGRILASVGVQDFQLRQRFCVL